MSTLRWIIVSATGLYLVAVISMYFLQRQFLYFPRQASTYEAEHNFEFQHEGITLRGWIVNPDRQDAMIYYGGNAERIDFFIQNFTVLFPAHTIYFVNYRGYGESEGKPTQEHLYGDALAIFDHVHKAHSRIDLIGKSLGSGIAVYVAAQRPVHKLALVTPYDSILNIAQSQYPIFPVSLLMEDTYESWKYANQISAETLILSAEHDRLIPARFTDNLAAHLPENILVTKQIKNTDHNSISGEPEYYDNLVDFFGNEKVPQARHFF